MKSAKSLDFPKCLLATCNLNASGMSIGVQDMPSVRQRLQRHERGACVVANRSPDKRSQIEERSNVIHPIVNLDVRRRSQDLPFLQSNDVEFDVSQCFRDF